ncbi:FecCD family ABC transporter permease [Terricaulis silvestris]|uniref:Putative ABC transporter permease protein n=1 Tax=Terricaulis silvestris TaxID=2686094 RepID=A0A6I6MKU3_9CAUL|nr:iron ABC transporter permease [Terricaulis silvestris]QGZ93257.1 putative ABC transporter permease protein [Terricaulis silvestris]
MNASLRASFVLALIGAVALAAGLALGPVATSILATDETSRVIVWEIRFPRSLTAWLVGAALGLSGAALQGLLRNPLADSGVLGLSGFAALGAVIAFAFGFAAFAPLLALLFALLAAMLVTTLGWAARGPASLVLIGVGLSSFAGGLIALALNLAPNPGALADLVNWTLGSVEGRSLEHVALVAGFLVVGAAFIFAAARGLQALTLGEEAAAAIGANLTRTRTLVVLGAAACTGGATAVAGVIGFVGIAAPHLVRALAGHDPARLLLPSALAGGAMLVCADVAVRLLPTDTELKLGVAAALIGGPVFALIAARLASRGGDA